MAGFQTFGVGSRAVITIQLDFSMPPRFVISSPSPFFHVLRTRYLTRRSKKSRRRTLLSLSLLPSLPFIAAFFASLFRSKKLFHKENFVDLFLLIRNSDSRRFDNNFSNKEKEGKRGGLEHFCKIIRGGREKGTRSMVKGRRNSFYNLLFPFSFFSSIDGAIYSALSFPLPLWKSSELISISFQ